MRKIIIPTDNTRTISPEHVNHSRKVLGYHKEDKTWVLVVKIQLPMQLYHPDSEEVHVSQDHHFIAIDFAFPMERPYDDMAFKNLGDLIEHYNQDGYEFYEMHNWDELFKVYNDPTTHLRK